MLDFVLLLEAALVGRTVWGLRSHEALVLLARDDNASPWLVTIVPKAVPDVPYEVRYLAARTQVPWPSATGCGNAATKEQAVEMVRTAVARCGGWG